MNMLIEYVFTHIIDRLFSHSKTCNENMMNGDSEINPVEDVTGPTYTNQLMCVITKRIEIG